MPRITKKQKEQRGLTPKSNGHQHSNNTINISHPRQLTKGKPRSHSHPSRGAHGSTGGFKVGPSRAPRDAYLGKARKIKAELIERARVKKQFAKVLQSEGLQSARLGDGSRRRGEKGSVSKTADAEQSGDEKDEDRAIKRDVKLQDKNKRKDKGKKNERDVKNEADVSTESLSKSSTTKSHQKEDKNFKIKPTIPPAPPSEPLPSLRLLKKEAYGKFNQPRHLFSTSSSFTSPSSLSSPASTTAGKAMAKSPAASSGRIAGKGFRGQPKMSARMDVLLEQIKRSKAV